MIAEKLSEVSQWAQDWSFFLTALGGLIVTIIGAWKATSRDRKEQ